MSAAANELGQSKSSLSSLILKDQRDKPFIKQILVSSVMLWPLASAFYFYSQDLAAFVVIYWVLIVFFLGPHLLMLHNACHRSPWKKPLKKTMENYLEVLGLLFGLPPMIYYHHHIKMHHREGNGPQDLSSTERYQRDSFLGWLDYFFRFIFLTPIELPLYFFKKGRKDFATKVIAGYVIFYGVQVSAFLYNPQGALFIFIVPTLICWFGLMGGNWAQHAFIDQKDPKNDFKNSITVVDSLYNKRCFNDGYHIAHHRFPGMHWTEMPAEFEENKDSYYHQDSMVFRTIDYQMIWLLLMLKQHRFLAKFYVPAKGEVADLDELAHKIKSKLKPVS